MAKRILVVDDYKLIRQLLTFPLRNAHYEVVEAVDGVEALEALERTPFDLAMIDINMPRMNGIDLIENIRSKGAPYSSIPIIVLTSEDSTKTRERAVAGGVAAYLLKQSDGKAVLETVEKVLQQQEAD